jgi:uncharacterized membrane protein YbhN (UPF0104 family)
MSSSNQRRPMKAHISLGMKRAVETALIYAVAGSIIWYEARGLNIHKEIANLASANLWWFIPASAVSFLVWFLGENFLFSRMFTLLHARTRFMEVLPATAAEFFLQAINSLASNGALMIFLHQRKRVPWLASAYTLAFFGFLDGLTFSFLIAVAGLLAPNSVLAGWSPFAACAFVLFVLIAAWWMWREPTYSFEKWLRSRPSLTAFRKADLPIYAELLAIRFAIVVPQGFLLWITLKAFHLQIPLINVLAACPAILASSGAPLTPAGLGPFQAVALYGLGTFVPRAKLMMAVLSFGIVQLLYRLPLGLGSAHVLVSRVLLSGEEFAHEIGRQSATPAPNSSINGIEVGELAETGSNNANSDRPGDGGVTISRRDC